MLGTREIVVKKIKMALLSGKEERHEILIK
jgi:hypothetical protein